MFILTFSRWYYQKASQTFQSELLYLLETDTRRLRFAGPKKLKVLRDNLVRLTGHTMPMNKNVFSEQAIHHPRNKWRLEEAEYGVRGFPGRDDARIWTEGEETY